MSIEFYIFLNFVLIEESCFASYNIVDDIYYQLLFYFLGVSFRSSHLFLLYLYTGILSFKESIESLELPPEIRCPADITRLDPNRQYKSRMKLARTKDRGSINGNGIACITGREF